MTTSEIIEKMNGYTFALTEKLGDWLSYRLPKISKDWWSELVLSKLTPLQRENLIQSGKKDIKSLDLAALLRITDKCWFVITSNSREFINNKERYKVRDMQFVRNRWAHITPFDISKDTVINDVGIIKELLSTFGAKNGEIAPIESFILSVEDDKHFGELSGNADDTATVHTEKNKPETENAVSKEIVIDDKAADIKAGDMVLLISDPTKVGVVMSKDGDKYTVFMDGKPGTYYKEQIAIQKIQVSTDFAKLLDVRAKLTAYQINNPGNSKLYSLNSARVDFVPYQFRPALKMIHSDSPRILIADDVGVGKTIEAGLIIKEMEARSELSSVLVICPRPLVAEKKWVSEMKRFDENFTQLDGREFAECMSETDRDGEWPERHAKTVIPYSLFGEDSILGTRSKSRKRHKTIGLSELDPLPHFDLVIVDEAHTIRNPGTWAYQAVSLFCENADAVVFLTATPLQNSNDDLYTLTNLLRPDLVIDKDTFNTMSEPNQYVNNLLKIIRSQEDGWQEKGKQEITNILSTSWGRDVIQNNPSFGKVVDFLDTPNITREEKMTAINNVENLHSFNVMINRTRRKEIEDFCIRRTEALSTEFTGTQQDLYDALIEFESKSLAILHGSRGVRFMMCTIMRQAASCIFGLAPFMNDLVNKRMNQISMDGELYENEGDVEINDEAYESLSELAGIIDKLSENIPVKDAKFDKMCEIIDAKQKEENNRVIIFSSFRHTLGYINDKLSKKGIRVGQVDGSVPDEERYNLRQRFEADRNDPDAIDVLLFSEIGCEGLDYQFCDTMINYDLPWNPMRIEQRIGRIDRRGQKSEAVKIYNLLTEGTIDAVIYERCLSKIGVFEASIGDCSEILGNISNEIMKIMFDTELTEDERKLKIEQLADNDVMRVQEINRLEQEEKSLYGFDLSKYMIDQEVQDAESTWINPQTIQELLTKYLSDFLGDGEYIKGKNEAKILRLASDKRQQLYDSLIKTDVNNSGNGAYKLWKAYLKSGKPELRITFDSDYAKENRNAAFLTQMHPLIFQASKYESTNFPCKVSLRISDSDLESGNYTFLIYAWRYSGLKPDIKLVPISEDTIVENNILSYLMYASDYTELNGDFEESWENLDKKHTEYWKEEKKKYSADAEEECNYRLDQLTHSYNLQESVLRKKLDKAIEDQTDERIIRMRKAEIENKRNKFLNQESEIKEAIGKADIFPDLLVKGVLHVD